MLEIRLLDGQLSARVRDQGRWREPSASDERGRGILIMRGLMDSVHLHVTRHGTTVVLRKRVATRSSKRVSSSGAQR